MSRTHQDDPRDTETIGPVSNHIILEGCDLTGKTTLAKYLSGALGYPIRKFSKPETDPFPEYKEALENKVPTILDRAYLGEAVYSRVKNRKSFLDLSRLQELESIANSQHTFNVYTTDTIENLKKRYEERGDDHVFPDELEKIVKTYDQQLEESDLSWYIYRINGEKGMEEVLQAYLKHRDD